jgi:DNA-binding CsgD family transcriptional regulator
VGREAELAGIERFLGPDARGWGLTLIGEAGIGKTRLWEAAVELARERGFVVLCARANDAEAGLPFAGLADLLDRVDLGGVAGVPSPQRQALEVALQRAEPFGSPPERFAFAAGFLSVVRSLAAGRGVVVAVDDVRWLDRPSAQALAFAARRLLAEPVRFVLSRRDGPPSELEAILERGRVDRVEVGPLSFGAIGVLLAQRLGRSLPRRVLRRVFDSSGGNPLFALELGRALLEHGVPEIGAELPLPGPLEDLFGTRVSNLGGPVRRVLLAVALSGGLRPAVLAALVGSGALEDALAEGLVVADGSGLRPSHPLLAAAVKRRSSAEERRDLHRELAREVADPTLRARHLALATSAADAELAADIAAAAVLASGRGAAEDAVELARHALRLTPPDTDDHSDRLLGLARCLFTAGDAGVSELLEGRLDALRSGAARAEASLLLAQVAIDPAQHLDRAIAESPGSPSVRARALARGALLLAIDRVERLAEAEGLAREARWTARSASGEVQRRALVALAWAHILRGHAVADLARSQAAPAAGSSLLESAIERPVAVRLAFRGQTERARSAFRCLRTMAEERGEAASAGFFHNHLCEVELRAGDANEAARLLGEFDQWTGTFEADAAVPGARLRAVLAAVQGDPQAAERHAAMVLEATESDPLWGWDHLEVLRAKGIAALFERDARHAAASLGAVWEHTVREGVDDPGAFPVAGDLVEALVYSGGAERAAVVIERLAELARAQEHPWGLATATRCAAMIALADGYDEEAATALRHAADEYRELGLWFERARSLLFLGRAQRRFKKRAGARESLEEARAAFIRLGCSGWAEQTGSELDRISGRRSADADELTASERRVVELAASGLSNKEIATQLYLSVHSIEAYLSRAYLKLGVRSRTQLAQRLADRG